MAHISFTKKSAERLKIDTTNAVKHEQAYPEFDDWIIDTVWNVKRDTWIMFYHKSSTFTVLIQPDKYKLENCIDLFLMLVQELLVKYGLHDRMSQFMNLFKSVTICRNNDKSSVAYMTQNKFSAHCGLENPNIEYRVTNLYDLMIYVNDMLRKKFDMKKTSLEAFIEVVKRMPIPQQHTLH